MFLVINQISYVFFYLIGGITKEQHLKLKTQQKQYIDAKEKLEAQLLKLKEQREALKEDGAGHEDKIMKENHKLQVMNPPGFFFYRNYINQIHKRSCEVNL